MHADPAPAQPASGRPVNVIEVQGLRKTYRTLRGGRTTVALDGLDLEIPEGGVFGLLGPNGSGKTTTIRCLLGLARPSAGTCRVLGRDPQTELHEVIGRIGALVEAPALFPTFSGRRNLELLAGMYGLPDMRVVDVLERVDLTERQNHLVKTYSLGMRQRLAIAAALLKDPDLLILDEPANGLDPAGIREVRRLLRHLGDNGKTVVVSSHILGEVQQLCDQVAILGRGRRIVQGPVADVLSHGGGEGLLVKVDDAERAVEVLSAAGMTAEAREEGLWVAGGPRNGADVVQHLSSAQLYPYEIRPWETDLETVFLELTTTTDERAET